MKLTNDERQFIRQRERLTKDIQGAWQQICLAMDKFKVGDYVVAYWPAVEIDDWNDEAEPRQLITNSHGLAKKYQVVYIDDNHIPYMKLLNKNNVPYGELKCPIKISHHIGETRIIYEFDVDPDYTDAILLENETNFNATQDLLNKTNLRKEIIEHNKKIKIKLNCFKDVQVFYSAVKAGDILWRSTKSSISVVEVITKLKPAGGSIRSLKILTNQNKEIVYRASQLLNMNLYTDQPRTFNETRDLI